MKVINLDKFNVAQKVSLADKEYEVSGMTVEQFLKGEGDLNLEDMDEKQQTEAFVKYLVKFTDIPEDILRKQQMGVLNAITMISQGGDPEKELEKASEKGGEGNPK